MVPNQKVQDQTINNFGIVYKRKLNFSLTNFTQKLSAIKYGVSKAAKRYAEYMKASSNNVQVLEYDFVISNTMPRLAASPDGKVIDKESVLSL